MDSAHSLMEGQISRGWPHENVARAVRRLPAVSLLAPILQAARPYVNRHGPPFGRTKMNAVEAGQGTHGKTCISRRRCWSAEIDLRRLVGLGVAGIAHIESDVQPAIAGSSDTQTGILEPRVGQTVTKGIERRNALPVEPTITDLEDLEDAEFT